MNFKRIALGYQIKNFHIILQTEATECGLACIAMIANYYGNNIELRELRQRFPVSLKGMNLGALTRVCRHLDLTNRALRVNLAALKQARLPCILHWNFNHYVILTKVGPNDVTIIDPALGLRTIDYDHLSRAFTGILIEVWPSQDFRQQKKKNSIKLRNIIGNIKALKKTIFIIFFLAIILELIVISFPFFIQLVIDNSISTKDQNILLTLALGFSILYFLKNIIISVRAWFIMYIGTLLNIQWKENVFHHLISLPVNFFEKRHIGDLTSRLSSIDVIQRTFTTSFVETFLDGILSLIIISILFNYNTTLGFIVVGSALIYVFIRWFWFAPIWKANRDEIIYNARQQSHLLETMRGIRPIKLFNKSLQRKDIWVNHFINQTNAKLLTQKIEIYYNFNKNIIFDLQNIIIIWLGATLVIKDDLTLGSFIAFIAYKGIFDTRISLFIDNIVQFKNLRLQADRLSDIVLTDPEELDQDIKLNEPLDGTIELIDVCFQYSLYEKNILNNISFKVENGESVAFIGSSGCGKSTLFSVILGILSPTSGQVKIGNINISKIGLENLRDYIGIVMQDDQLFAGSIAENITFFDENPDDEWMNACARIAAIESEILSMPMKFQTLVGDMGTVLSGGQKQRILLARALYKRPKILLLDEATSHLDILKEKNVNEEIKKLKITRLIIAHRPETIISADRVLLLKNGRIENELEKHNLNFYLNQEILTN
ncbi:peptidase domain-containing ABC transporter [Acinetobacter baumannii]|uniref:peptidase domain-containing ABC transporter n=1 Tax=Acinetobacter baumannii TaxID=470 RepID=UPI002341F845|nr:peptidase domain-containing ABC transporter [Acinetobacter baumannii]